MAPASSLRQRWELQVEQRTDLMLTQPGFAAQFADATKTALGDLSLDASVADLDRYRIVAHVAMSNSRTGTLIDDRFLADFGKVQANSHTRIEHIA